MSSILVFLSSINWAAPTWDVFIFLSFVIGSLLYGLSLGRDRVVLILIAMYMALAIVSHVPLLSRVASLIPGPPSSLTHTTVIIAVFIVLFFLISRGALVKTIGMLGGESSAWQAVVFSLLQIGLLISIVLSVLPPTSTSGISELNRRIFLSDEGKSAWVLLPVLAMALLPRRTSGA